MTIFRFKSILAASLLLCACDNKQAARDQERIEELEAEVERLSNPQSSKSASEIFRDAQESRESVDTSYQNPLEETAKDLERKRLDADNLELRRQVLQMERDKLNREIQEEFGK